MYKYLFAFIVYLTVIFIYSFYQYNEKISDKEEILQRSVQHSFDAAVNSFELINDLYYYNNESKLAKIIKDAASVSLKERDSIRYRVRETFTGFYNMRKLSFLKDFTIVDSKGYTILRFHDLEKYDDYIIGKRKSLKRIMEGFYAQSGMEIDLYHESYKYQYPLFFDGAFVGSFEYGMDFKAIDEQMRRIFDVKNILFLQKKRVDAILSKNRIKKRYIKVDIAENSFYTAKEYLNNDQKYKFDAIIENDKFKNNIGLENITFSYLDYMDRNFIVITTPMRDINNEKIGYLVSCVDDTYSSEILVNALQAMTILSFFGFVVFLFLYKKGMHKKYIMNLINIQKDMLIVTDGVKIHDANRAFLDFFGYKTLEMFKNKHSCICDFFLNENGYLHKDMNGVNWFEYLKEHPNIYNVVVIRDKNAIKRYFRISIDGVSHSQNHVLLFKDITKELIREKKLKNKAYFDALTKIYSRESFNYYLEKKSFYIDNV